MVNLVENNKFENINHYYSQRGHSFNPCDRDFALIKRVLQKLDRLYTLEQIGELMIRSSSYNKFLVKYVTSNDIMNFSRWWPQYYKKFACLMTLMVVMFHKRKN